MQPQLEVRFCTGFGGSSWICRLLLRLWVLSKFCLSSVTLLFLVLFLELSRGLPDISCISNSFQSKVLQLKQTDLRYIPGVRLQVVRLLSCSLVLPIRFESTALSLRLTMASRQQLSRLSSKALLTPQQASSRSIPTATRCMRSYSALSRSQRLATNQCGRLTQLPALTLSKLVYLSRTTASDSYLPVCRQYLSLSSNVSFSTSSARHGMCCASGFLSSLN